MIRADSLQRIETGLLLMPKMLQSLEVLQLASVDLLELIGQELEQNETLEARPLDPERDARAADRDDWDRPSASNGSETDGKQALLDNLSAKTNSLLHHVREQLAWSDLEPTLHDDVLALVELLDERGFLIASDEELLEVVDGESFGEALAVLRSLDPVGVGARDPIDALLMQVPADDPDRADIRVLLTEHLEALAMNQLPEIARHMSCTVADVQLWVQMVRELDPHPATRFTGEAAQRLHPDLVVSQREGELEVLVNDTDLPSLGVNEDYAAMASSPLAAPDVVQYLRPKLESARNLISAVEQRRKTLARVGAAILQYQRVFLTVGKAALRPLKMAEIAAMLDLHTSTVSRAVAGKSVQTDRGIYRLRDFFDGARVRGSGGGGEGAARLGIQQRIRELIDGEAPERPYSDHDLVTLLAAAEVRVARRTVTKYRKELGIPSSWKRRRSWGGP